MVPTYTLVASLVVLVACVAGQGYRQQGYAGRQAPELQTMGSYATDRNMGGLQRLQGAGAYDPMLGDNQYKFRIYNEPEYYGYESVFPGGRANFKGYRSAPDAGGYGARGVNRENLELARPDNRFKPSAARGRY